MLRKCLYQNNAIVIFAAAILFSVIGREISFGQTAQNPVSTAIEVNVGENAVISLEANHSTGYSWQLAKPVDAEMLQFVDKQYETDESQLIGGGGKEVWTFKALKSGKTEMTFNYVRPWEKDVPPARVSTVVIIIK